MRAYLLEVHGRGDLLGQASIAESDERIGKQGKHRFRLHVGVRTVLYVEHYDSDRVAGSRPSSIGEMEASSGRARTWGVRGITGSGVV